MSRAARPPRPAPEAEPSTGVRLDKWLWAARFFKTRSLAGDAIDKGRISVNGSVAKASRDLRVGDMIGCKQDHGAPARTFEVKRLASTRGSAPVAQTLYAELADSIQAREAHAEAMRRSPEPAMSIADGRPTKRDRRDLARWDRWSASADQDSS